MRDIVHASKQKYGAPKFFRSTVSCVLCLRVYDQISLDSVVNVKSHDRELFTWNLEYSCYITWIGRINMMPGGHSRTLQMLNACTTSSFN